MTRPAHIILPAAETVAALTHQVMVCALSARLSQAERREAIEAALVKLADYRDLPQ